VAEPGAGDPPADPPAAPAARRFGFVAVLGAPNAGKSTLVNRLVGAKVSIVSPKVQTTRSRVLGIALHGAAQLVLVDTPGIFQPRRRLDRSMVQAAWQGAADADLVLLLVDAAQKRLDDDSRAIIAGLAKARRTAILGLNKIDQIRPERLLALTAEINALCSFDATFMISALTGDGVGDLLDHLAGRLPPGPWHYPEDQLSDMPQRLLAAELTREQLFLQLHRELPYALTVESESWEEFKDGSAKVNQVIFVRKDSQKAIVLGQGGQRIKAVREAAQAELEAMLGRPVHLFLFVKVRDNWQDDRERYRELGLDFDA
jgi:GTP-binding protein Era